MHLLYLDDSGSTSNKNEEYIVLGGVSVFEAQVHFITTELDNLAQSINPSDPSSVEFHASEIFARRCSPWDKMNKEEAKGVIKSVLKILASSYDSAVAFACAIHKNSFNLFDPIELAFEDLCQRFDIYLSKMQFAGDRQRGLLILDEHAKETTLQKMSRDFRTIGTKWGVIRSIAEVPLFVDSRASRLIQMADHIAYAVYRRYNSGDTSYFDIIASKFQSSEGIIHGLVHKHKTGYNCMCPACFSRRGTSVR
jgi:hypothetical protein